MAVTAGDPLQQMMKLNGAYAEIEDMQERMSVISRVVGYGFSWCLLTGVLVSPVLELLGTKLTALLGIAMHAGGYLLMFFVPDTAAHYAAGFLFGFAFQCILNSHLSVGCLFPRCPSLVLAIVGAAPDLSLFIPPSLLNYAQTLDGPNAVQKTVIRYLLFFVIPAAVIDLLFVPWRPFTSASTKAKPTATQGKRMSSEAESSKVPSVDVHAGEASTLLVQNSENGGASMAAAPVPVYGHLPLMHQLLTPDYWIFMVFMIGAVLRKKYTATAIRFVLEEHDPDPQKSYASFYTNMYNLVVPYGFVPAIIWGGLVDYCGSINLMIASNVIGVIYTATSLIPNIQVQAVTVAVFIIYQSFILGQAFAFCASMYGFQTLAGLQGIGTTLFGVCSLVMDAYIYPYITATLRSHWKANLGILFISLGMFIFPCLLLLLQQVRQRRAKRKALNSAVVDMESDCQPLAETVPDALNAVFPITTCYEKKSLQMMYERRSGSH